LHIAYVYTGRVSKKKILLSSLSCSQIWLIPFVNDQQCGYLTKLKNNKGVVCHTVALPFTFFKKYLKAKEELWKLKYFSMQKYNLKKNPLKETKILQDIIITL
jgi:hypothetical protein